MPTINNNLVKYIIVGSGSKLYKKLKKPNIDVIELRTNEAINDEFYYDQSFVVVIFSLLGKEDLAKIEKKFSGIKIIVGSCAALSTISKKFKYSKFKLMQLEYVLSNGCGFKYIIFGDFFPDPTKKGLQYLTKIEDFWEICNKAANDNRKIYPSFSIVGCENLNSKILSLIDLHFSPISTWIIKNYLNYTYGYSNAKNSKYYQYDLDH
jgi:hypothetical protein